MTIALRGGAVSAGDAIVVELRPLPLLPLEVVEALRGRLAYRVPPSFISAGS